MYLISVRFTKKMSLENKRSPGVGTCLLKGKVRGNDTDMRDVGFGRVTTMSK